MNTLEVALQKMAFGLFGRGFFLPKSLPGDLTQKRPKCSSLQKGQSYRGLWSQWLSKKAEKKLRLRRKFIQPRAKLMTCLAGGKFHKWWKITIPNNEKKTKVKSSSFLPRGFRALAPTGLENCPLSRQMTAASKMYQQSCPKSRWCRWQRTVRQPSLNQLLILAVNGLPQNSVIAEEMQSYGSLIWQP